MVKLFPFLGNLNIFKGELLNFQGGYQQNCVVGS